MGDVSGGRGEREGWGGGVTAGSEGTDTLLLVFKVSLYETEMCPHTCSWYKCFIIVTSMLPKGDLQVDLQGDPPATSLVMYVMCVQRFFV